MYNAARWRRLPSWFFLIQYLVNLKRSLLNLRQLHLDRESTRPGRLRQWCILRMRLHVLLGAVPILLEQVVSHVGCQHYEIVSVVSRLVE